MAAIIRTFCPVTEEEQKAFLKKNYQYLVARIQTPKFYPHLINEEVIDQMDKQTIERENLTNVDRAGGLIDLISTRGTSAFNAFMTVLEYEYRDHYEKITHTTARRPPSGWRPRMASMRFETLTMMFTSFQSLMCSEIKEKLDDGFDKLKNIEGKLFESEHEATKELQSLEDDINDVQTKLDKSNAENSELREQLKKSKLKETRSENEILQLRRNLSSVNQNLKIANGDISLERERSQRWKQMHQNPSRGSADGAVVSHTTNHALLEMANEKMKAEITALNNEVKSLENQIVLQKSEMDTLNTEMSELTEQIQRDREQYNVLEDDFIGEQRKMEMSIERQNSVCRQLQKKCEELESERELWARKQEGLENVIKRIKNEQEKSKKELAESQLFIKENFPRGRGARHFPSIDS